ncbi:hypothetical protein SBY92_000285 [Candida maltosa Xu316]
MATYAKKRAGNLKKVKLSNAGNTNSNIFDHLNDNLSISPVFDFPDDLNKTVKPKRKKPSPKPSRVKKSRVVTPTKQKVKLQKSKNDTDPWDLLDDIDDSTVHVPKVLINESSEDESTENTPSLLHQSFELDLDLEPIDSSPNNKIHEIQQSNNSSNKTYSQDRSYLIHDHIVDPKLELGEKIRNMHDYSNDEDSMNINDLRTSGKLNQFEDIIDGLSSNVTNLQLSSLLELIDNEDSHKLISHVIPLVEASKEIIRHIASIVMLQIFRDNVNDLRTYQSELHVVWLGLKLKVEINQVPKIYREVIKNLTKEDHGVDFLQLVKENHAATKKLCLLQLEKTTDSGLDLILEYLEGGEFTSTELLKFKSHFDACFNTISDRNHTQIEIKLMKIFAVLTTTHQKNSITPLLQPDWIPTMIEHSTITSSSDMTICILGVLVNLVEWGLVCEPHIDLINRQIPKLTEISRDNEVNQHIIGYNSIILGQLKLKYSSKVNITNEILITNLSQFKTQIETKSGLYSVVCNLIISLMS